MRWLWVCLLLPLTGCVSDAEPEVHRSPLTMYAHQFDGSTMLDARLGRAVGDEEAGFGLLYTLSNGPEAVAVEACLSGVAKATVGYLRDGAWYEEHLTDANVVTSGRLCSEAWIMEGNASTAFMAHVTSVGTLADNGTIVVEWITGPSRLAHATTWTPSSLRTVDPGMHVLTETVGLWTNGTSFYTNVASLLEDPAFPAGGHIDRDAAAASSAPLPIYVYGEENSEQPARSRDTCHFTTISGYNALLKRQTELAAGVRFLEPTEAYTREGAEDHLLYGDALLFLNTIVAIEGQTTTADQIPDPQGACFDPTNHIPTPPGALVGLIDPVA